MKPHEILVATPYGEGCVQTYRARGPIATLLLSHGAGKGVDSPDLEALAANLPRHGISVALFEQPWRRAGRPVATAPATLDAALITAAERMRTRTPLILGGRSAGARSAARTARTLAASGLLALSFPLHPPGKPEKSRIDELRGVRRPTLIVQGERDVMGLPEEFPAGLDLVVVPGADHSLQVPKRGAITQAEAMDLVVESTLEWLVRDVLGNAARA